jgi:farnesyl-diphosphate farnesyltransferase
VDQRLQALQQLRQRVFGSKTEPIRFGKFALRQGAPAERALLEQCENSLALLDKLSAFDARLVREVLDTITSGQELDLRRFADASSQRVVALATDAELDDYTFRVAGSVGQFWTKICRAHLFPKASIDESRLLSDAVRFGQGLQLVNILRDLAVDLRQGRCYLPEARLAALELAPADLLNLASESRFRPLYHHYLDRAKADLLAGWAYTNALPRACVRVRLACAWPVLIGLETLRLLRLSPMLDPQKRIKIERLLVKRIILRSVLFYPARKTWSNLASSATRL